MFLGFLLLNIFEVKVRKSKNFIRFWQISLLLRSPLTPKIYTAGTLAPQGFQRLEKIMVADIGFFW